MSKRPPFSLLARSILQSGAHHRTTDVFDSFQPSCAHPSKCTTVMRTVQAPVLASSCLMIHAAAASLRLQASTLGISHRRNSLRGSSVKKLSRSQYSLRRSQVLFAPEAMAKIIDGKATAEQVRSEVAAGVAKLKETTGKVPGLAVVLVGSRRDSETYVRNKEKACKEVGIESMGTKLAEDVTQEELLKVVQDYNADPNVHGILVQLPLPDHINAEEVLDAISYEKDVDGFHPMNVGLLALKGRDPLFVSCTPQGVLELLDRYDVAISGKQVVVVGRSNIVGTPVAILMQQRDGTVTIVHSRTPNAQEICRSADIVIAACGKAQMVKGDWIKEGAVVVDVGINAIDDSSTKKGYRLVGDVDFSTASEKASSITPVPGGVGPMTIAMLLRNTLRSAERFAE